MSDVLERLRARASGRGAGVRAAFPSLDPTVAAEVAERMEEPVGFFEGLRGRGAERVPFIGGGVRATRLDRFAADGAAIQQGEAEPERVERFVREAAERQRPRTFMGEVGEVVGGSATFAAEIAIPGGAAARGARGAAALLRAGAQGRRLRTTAAKVLASKAGEQAAGLGTTLIAQEAVPRILGFEGGAWTAATLERNMPGVSMTEDEAGGLAVFLEESFEDFYEAGAPLWEGLVDQAIELGSERTGGLVGKIPLLRQLQAAQGALVGKVIADRFDGDVARFLAEAGERFAYDGGLVGELFEERVGALARAGVPGFDETLGDVIPTWRQLAVETLALGGVGGAGLAAGAAASAANVDRDRVSGSEERAVERVQGVLQDFTEETAEVELSPANAPQMTFEARQADVDRFQEESGQEVQIVAPESEANQALEATANALGYAVTFIRGATPLSRPAAMGEGGHLMIGVDEANAMDLLAHEVVHGMRQRMTPQEFERLRGELEAAAPGVLERASARYEAESGARMSSERLAEEGVAVTAEEIARMIRLAGTREGRADLEQIAEGAPSAFRRLLDGVRDFVRSLSGRDAESFQAAVERVESETGVDPRDGGARMALLLRDLMPAVEQRRLFRAENRALPAASPEDLEAERDRVGGRDAFVATGIVRDVDVERIADEIQAGRPLAPETEEMRRVAAGRVEEALAGRAARAAVVDQPGAPLALPEASPEALREQEARDLLETAPVPSRLDELQPLVNEIVARRVPGAQTPGSVPAEEQGAAPFDGFAERQALERGLTGLDTRGIVSEEERIRLRREALVEFEADLAAEVEELRDLDPFDGYGLPGVRRDESALAVPLRKRLDARRGKTVSPITLIDFVKAGGGLDLRGVKGRDGLFREDVDRLVEARERLEADDYRRLQGLVIGPKSRAKRSGMSPAVLGEYLWESGFRQFGRVESADAAVDSVDVDEVLDAIMAESSGNAPSLPQQFAELEQMERDRVRSMQRLLFLDSLVPQGEATAETRARIADYYDELTRPMEEEAEAQDEAVFMGWQYVEAQGSASGEAEADDGLPFAIRFGRPPYTRAQDYGGLGSRMANMLRGARLRLVTDMVPHEEREKDLVLDASESIVDSVDLYRSRSSALMADARRKIERALRTFRDLDLEGDEALKLVDQLHLSKTAPDRNRWLAVRHFDEEKAKRDLRAKRTEEALMAHVRRVGDPQSAPSMAKRNRLERRAASAAEAAGEMEDVLELGREARDPAFTRQSKIDWVRENLGEWAVTGSGITDAEAAVKLEEARQKLGPARADAYLEFVREMNESRLEHAARSGLLRTGQREAWQEREPYWTSMRDMSPLMEQDPPPMQRSSSIQPMKRQWVAARGRGSAAESSTLSWADEYLRRIDQAEKNAALQAAIKQADRDDMLGVRRVQIVTPEVRAKAAQDGKFVRVFEHGVESFLEFESEEAARALNKMDAANTGLLVNTIGRATRLFSSLVTGRNPAFWVPNLLRDSTQAVWTITAERDFKSGLEVMANAWKALPTLIRFYAMESTGRDLTGDVADRYREARDAGVLTTWLGNANLQELLVEMHDALTKPSGLMHRARTVVGFLDAMSTAFEGAVRFAAYEQQKARSLAAGMGMVQARNQAALYGKRLTVNFDQKGTLTPEFAAIYSFFNPAVQGTRRLLGAATKGKNGRKAVVSVVLLGAAMEALGYALGDDDELTGLNTYGNIPLWEKQRNIVFPFAIGGVRPKVTLPYGLDWIYGSGSAMLHALTEIDPRRGRSRVIQDHLFHGLSTFNPVGGTESVFTAMTPTVLRPLAEVEQNRKFGDRPLMPRGDVFGREVADSARFFSTIDDRASGRLAQYVADVLNLGGPDEVPTGLDVSPETIQHFLEFVGSGFGLRDLDRVSELVFSKREVQGANIVPFFRSFFSAPTTHHISQSYYELRNAASTQYARVRGASTPEIARALVDEDRKLWGMRSSIQRLDRAMAPLRKEMNLAETSRQRRIELRKQVTALQARVVRAYYGSE